MRRAFERTAGALQHSAALADSRAAWLELTGRLDEGRSERLAAARARAAALRAERRASAMNPGDRRL